MASQANIAARAPDVVAEIILLHPDQIDASNRLRPIDPVWAEALAGVMEAEGQRTPIEVCRLPGRSDYTLVVGGHRHAAAALKGMMLRAEVVTSDANERRLREVSENLHRRDLEPLDRAAFLAELVTAHKLRGGLNENQDGRTASVNARWQKALKDEAGDTNATIALVYGWADEVADTLGFSRRTVYNDLLLIRRLPASIIDRLRKADHAILGNATQLRALAKLDPAEQSATVARLVAGAKTVAAARGDAKPKPTADAKNLNAFLGAFDRMSLAEKKGALAMLAHRLPAGWALTGPKGGEA